MVIDEIIAGTRNVDKQYPAHFFYTEAGNAFKEFNSNVYSSLNEINMKDLQEQTKLSDKVIADAAAVATILAKE